MPAGSSLPAEYEFESNDVHWRQFLESDLESFKSDGFVSIHEFLPKEKTDGLKLALDEALGAKMRSFGVHPVEAPEALMRGNAGVLNDFTPKGGNHDLNRWNMHLPSALPWLDESIFAHPRVLALVKSLIGPDAVCYLLASDTPLPGACFQGAHQDFSRFSVALNIPLVDVGRENAPLEVWPGTHRASAASDFDLAPHFASADAVREIVSRMVSRRLSVPAGTAILRDHRLVHRGTANLSHAARPMLSIYYVAPHEPVPGRRFADLAARAALALRRAGRGSGGEVARPAVVSLGNLLGRVVEEQSLSDRDRRRMIPAALWDGLSPQARHLLRFASVDPEASVPALAAGSIRGSLKLLAVWAAACREFITAALSRRPRRPDEESQ